MLWSRQKSMWPPSSSCDSDVPVKYGQNTTSFMNYRHRIACGIEGSAFEITDLWLPMWCGTDENVIVDILKLLVQKVIKSHMECFLRVTIALEDSEAATKSVVKVTKKPNLLLWGMHITAEKHGELLLNKPERSVVPFLLCWPNIQNCAEGWWTMALQTLCWVTDIIT